MDRTIRVALYGGNGHQLNPMDLAPRGCELVGHALLRPGTAAGLPATDGEDPLGQLIALAPELIVLCSPRREEQAADAIRCLAAGVSVLAEKPCAPSEAELDRILTAAKASGARFHEMAGTAFAQPYWQMRELIAAGTIGDLVQVSVQKSYPMQDSRPLEEAVDGGLIPWVGVHALRYVEHVSGRRIDSVDAIDAAVGDARPGSELRTAACIFGRLDGGALFSAICNYANPRGFGSHGNEMLRVWGTGGMVESVDAGARTRLIVGDDDRGPLPEQPPPQSHLDQILAELRGESAPLLDLETELHPTRVALRAASAAREQRRKNEA